MTTQTLPWYCSKVGSQYGSPMGRDSYGVISTAADQSLTVVKLSMDLVDRAYDLGGAYWGHVPGSYIYCCYDNVASDDGICRYVRATSEAEAIEKFGVKPEQLSPTPNLWPRSEPVISLDVYGDGTEVDVTALIKAFANSEDFNGLMMDAGEFCLCGSASSRSWIYAQEEVECWAFTNALYQQLEAYFRSIGIDDELSRLDLRAMLLQEVSLEYIEWLRRNEFTDKDCSMTFAEYLSREDSNGSVYAAEDGSYYLSIDE